MNEVKTNSFLKVMSIIMLVCGIISAIVSLIAAVGAGALAYLSEGSSLFFLVYVSVAIAIVGSVLQIVAGAKGIGASKDPAKVPACTKLGITIIALSILSTILGVIAGTGFDFFNLILSLIIPGLYTYSTMQK